MCMFLGGEGTGFSPDSQRVLCTPKMFKPLSPDHQITNTFTLQVRRPAFLFQHCAVHSIDMYVPGTERTMMNAPCPSRAPSFREVSLDLVSQPRSHASEASLVLILEPKSLTAKLTALCPSRGALQGLWLARVPSGGQNQQDEHSMRKVLRSHREPGLEL